MSETLKNHVPSIKVLTVGPDYRYPNGGIAKLLNTYSKFFDNFGFVATMRAPEQGKESKLRTGFRMINGLTNMTWKILFKKYKIVHIHTASGISFVRESMFLYLASFLGAKTILHIHSGSLKEFYDTYPNFIGRCLRKATKVVTIAKVWERYLNEKGHNNVVTIGNPIGIPNTEEEVIRGETVNLLFLGLICENKGIWDILEMVKNHADELRGKLIINVGGNGDVERLKKYVKENKIEDIVEYLGWITGERKVEILSTTQIYLQPSYHEALGIAILEAMSYKVPVIASDTGGIPEIVHDSENGYLITPGDTEGLFNAIMRMLSSEEERKKMGEKGFEIAKDYYPEAIKNKLNDLYNSI